MDGLRQQNLQGEAFEAAAHQAEQTQAALAQIPRFFSTDEETDVLAKADRDGTVLAHQTLESARPVLARLLAQTQA